MRRLVALALVPAAALAVLVASEVRTPAQDPEAAYEAAQAARTAGDGERAWSLFTEAAGGGHLAALRTVAEARDRGYLTVDDADGRGATGHVGVLSLPGQAALARLAFRHALADSAQTGRPEVLLMLAQELHGEATFVNGELRSDWSGGGRDSAAAIYHRIKGADLPRLQLALLAKALGDDDAYRQHVDEAAAAGEPHGCAFKLYFTGDRHDTSTVSGLSRYLDAAGAACPPGGPDDPAAETVRTLAEQAAAGNGAAVDVLDGLRAEGVFERHPRLAALVPGAGA